MQGWGRGERLPWCNPAVCGSGQLGAVLGMGTHRHFLHGDVPVVRGAVASSKAGDGVGETELVPP